MFHEQQDGEQHDEQQNTPSLSPTQGVTFFASHIDNLVGMTPAEEAQHQHNAEIITQFASHQITLDQSLAALGFPQNGALVEDSDDEHTVAKPSIVRAT